MTVAFASVVSVLLLQAAVPPQPPVPPVVAAPVPPDPATSAFLGEAGLILAAIKPAAIADYELVIRTLNEALFKDTDATRKEATKGWRVFKASSPDAKGNTLYIHVFLPAVVGFDYRPSLLVDALVKELAPAMLSLYQDAFAGPPSKLDLTELANMALAPIPPPVATPATVPAPAPPAKKPGGAT